MTPSKSYGLQNETKQYLRKLYAYGRELAPTDVADIDNFIKGLKQLNLWQNIVCWPMRSIHNIGSTSRLLSLGGVGQYDGTLTNGPTWGVNGITYDGVNDNITTQFTLGAVRVFCGVVGDMPTSGNKGNFLAGVNSAGQAIYWLNPRSGFGGEYLYNGSAANSVDNVTTGTHMWSFIGGHSLRTQSYRSLTLLNTSSNVGVVPFPNQLSLGLRLGRGNGIYQGTAAFCFICLATPSTPNDFYQLYKTTIGKGLGLL